MFRKGEKMSRDKNGIDLSSGIESVTSSDWSLICFYNRMIKNAKANIGAKTNNGVVINESLINNLTERRKEILTRVSDARRFEEVVGV